VLVGFFVRRRRLRGTLLVALLLCSLATACGGSTNKASDVPAATATPGVTAAPTSTAAETGTTTETETTGPTKPQRITCWNGAKKKTYDDCPVQPPPPPPSAASLLRPALAELDLPVGDDPQLVNASGGTAVVRYKIADNLTAGLIRNGIAQDTFAIMEAARDSGAKWKTLIVRGMAPLVDKYGKESVGIAFLASFPRRTVNRIQFDNIDTGSLTLLRSLTYTGNVGILNEWRDW
jgi:hypothetical protein